ALAVAMRAVVAAFAANVLMFAINASGAFPKLAYYLGRSGQDSSLEMLFFATAMLTVFGFSILTVPMHRGCKGAFLVRYCAISTAAALALLGFVPTLRNRIFYELIIIAALIAPHCYRGKLYRAALVALATVFFLAQFARQAA